MTWTHLGVLPVIGCSSYFVEACVWGSWTLSILHMHRADHSSAIMYKILLLSVYIHCGTSSNDKAHGKTADAWEIAIFFLCTFYLVLTKFDLALKAASATSIFCNEISHHASEFWPGCWLTRFWMDSCNIHHSGTLSDVTRRSSLLYRLWNLSRTSSWKYVIIGSPVATALSGFSAISRSKTPLVQPS